MITNTPSKKIKIKLMEKMSWKMRWGSQIKWHTEDFSFENENKGQANSLEFDDLLKKKKSCKQRAKYWNQSFNWFLGFPSQNLNSFLTIFCKDWKSLCIFDSNTTILISRQFKRILSEILRKKKKQEIKMNDWKNGNEGNCKIVWIKLIPRKKNYYLNQKFEEAKKS